MRRNLYRFSVSIGFVTWVLIGLSPVAAQAPAPWQSTAGKACFKRWIEEAMTRLNAYHGTDEFNARKPWSINRFGVLEANPKHRLQSGYPPSDFAYYHNNRYWSMWDQYHYYQWRPETGWNLPEWNAAKIPPLREYVQSCLAQASPGSETTESKSQTFFEPKIAGYRLDWCLYHANQCGKPAADRFCRLQGFVSARTWQKATNISHATPTYILGDERVCKVPGCDGFILVACQTDFTPPRGDMEHHIARWGADYRRVDLATPELCQAECVKERRCKAWSHIKPSDQAVSARCWLKHSVPKPIPNACCTSGVKVW